MQLSLGSSERSAVRPNRRVRRPPPEGSAKAGDRPTKVGRVASGGGRNPRANAAGESSVRGRLRRIGAVLWPERFPELAASRSERLASRQGAPRGFIWIWALAVTLAAIAFIVHLNIRFEVIQTGYALSQAQGEQRQLRLTQRELRLELATLKEPGRIEAQARTDLGMDRPDHQRIIRLDDGGTRRRGATGGAGDDD